MLPTSLPGGSPSRDHRGPPDLAVRGERGEVRHRARPRAACGRRARRAARRHSRRAPARGTSRRRWYGEPCRSRYLSVAHGRRRGAGRARGGVASVAARLGARRPAPLRAVARPRRRGESRPEARRDVDAHQVADRDGTRASGDRRALRRGQHGRCARGARRTASRAPVLDITRPGPGRRRAGPARARVLARRHEALRPLLDAERATTRLDEYAIARRPAPTRRRAARSSPSTQPQANHNGGQLVFGPDGLLYIGLGDGGGAGDQGAGHTPRRQRAVVDTLLGKILRIDPRARRDRAYTVPADNPFVDGDGAARDLGVRPAQPVAVLVRPRDRRPLDRRRRPERRRGDRRRLPRRHDRRRRTSAGTCSRACTRIATGPHAEVVAAGPRDRPRRRQLLGHRRLRLPRARRSPPRGGYLFTDYCNGTLRARR